MSPTLVWLALGLPVGPPEPAPPPALTVRLVQPHRQVERVLALFEGAPAPHPAAALAAWRRATRRSLSKSTEAVIAAFNPGMARELRAWHEAEVVVSFEPADGRARWFAMLPHDDGSIAALATALALTDGGSDPPIDGRPVDRLGPPGAPLMARADRGVVVAGTRDDLRRALEHVPPVVESSGLATGWWLRLDPRGMAGAGPLEARRLAEALLALGCQHAVTTVTLEGTTFALVLRGQFRPPAPGQARIDPVWLDWVPAERTVAAVTLALDPRPAAWDRAFVAADRVEKVDPALARAAPLRVRLNLLARAAGARPEADLWPWLAGLTGGLLADPSGTIAGAFLVLHARDEPAAERWERVVLPRLALAWRLPERGPTGLAVTRLGEAAGRPWLLTRRGASVLVAWGDDSLAASLDARAHPDHSAGAAIRSAWGPSPPQRAGALWVGRLPGLTAPVAAALAQAPPVLWWGTGDDQATRDEVRWAGLDGTVRRFLENLPLDPNPRSPSPLPKSSSHD